jgi:hypothetical protein
MRQHHPRLRVGRAIVVSLSVALFASACGHSASAGKPAAPSSAVTSPSRSTTSTTSGPNPNATETPPPGDIPDNQVYVHYAPASKAYSLQVPEGWAMTHPGRATLFTDKYNSIRVDSLHVAKAPTVASAKANELPAIKASARGFAAGAVTKVARTAGSAVKITYQADSAPNPVTGKVVVEAVERYEFWRRGTEVVLTLSGAVGSDNVDPWRKVTDSFGWKP